ncbi:MAG: hypothetical protein N2316_08500 [Spirochaetes bacterium]|nr:hypothetical protein [Spirochaetota bacterium]
MKKPLVFIMLCASAFIGVSMVHSQEAGVAKLSYGPNLWIDVHLLFQMQYTNTYSWESGIEQESDGAWKSDFAPRRMRVMFNGQVAPNVTFFVESDIAGTLEQYYMFLQDAYVNYKIADELQIAFGMILLPFMHHNRESAVSLLGVDYNTAAVKMSEHVVWRDYGVEARGLLAGGMVDYRIGLFDGIERDAGGKGTDDDINPNGLPRIVGRVQINLMEPETGFFYSGNYLGKKKIVSFGAGIDYMKDAVYDGAKNEVNDYFAWTVDATVDYPIDSNMVVAFQAGYVKYSWSPTLGVEDAYSYYAQAGFLWNGTWQPVLRYEATVEDVGGKDDSTAYLHVGLNYFISGHNANIKIDFRYPTGEYESIDKKQSDFPDEKKFTLQAQIFI